MNLTIKRAEFLKMLMYAGQAIPTRSAEAQQMNYLIDVREASVSVIASNDDLACKITQTMKDEKGKDVILNLEPGLIQTPAKYLLDIVSKMGGDVITLRMVDTNYLNVSDEATEFNLVTKAGEEYPDVDLNVPEEAKGFTVSLRDLKRLFDTTAYAVSVKGPKELYTGINVRASSGKLFFMTTDSFRMARLSVPEPNNEADFNFTCPVKALDMITRIDTNADCTIYFDERRAIFISGQVTLSSRLILGEFPSIDRLIPPSFPFQLTCDTSEFLAAADRVKIISSAEDKNSQVKLSMSKETGAMISAKSTNYGNSQEVLKKAIITLPDDVNVFEIGFNVDFAIEAAKALRSDKITFTFSSPTRMFMIKNDDAENLQIITPIRMSSFN